MIYIRQLTQQLLAQSTPSVLAQLSGSPNRLLFAGSATALKFPPAHELNIGLLQGDTAVSRGRWTARATVRVVNASGKPMGGVKVSGLFQGASAPVSCSTAASGLCTLVSLPQGADVARLSVAVQALEGAAFTYRRERDQARAITIQRPGGLARR